MVPNRGDRGIRRLIGPDGVDELIVGMTKPLLPFTTSVGCLIVLRVHVEDERLASGLAEAAIGEADAVSFDELCRRGLVAVLVHRDSLWRRWCSS
jgi:hypothetical protein